MKSFERKYHATWVRTNGLSPLAKLGAWMYAHHVTIESAPRDLLVAAASDVAGRLPAIAAREPTRRHRKHFAWLLGWHERLSVVIGALA